MTVGELIQRLQQYSPELQVLVSEDWEGNSFSDCCDVSLQLLDEDMEPADPDDETACKFVVLWP